MGPTIFIGHVAYLCVELIVHCTKCKTHQSDNCKSMTIVVEPPIYLPFIIFKFLYLLQILDFSSIFSVVYWCTS